MAAPPRENSDWAFDYGLLGDLPPLEPCFQWASPLDALPPPTSLRLRPGVCGASDSKASKEKMRRNRLNDRFQELCVLLEHGRSLKMDKTVILTDAIRMVIQLREEAQKLKESNDNLQGKASELKTEKSELRDEKTTLKAKKEKLEHQVKEIKAQSQNLPHHLPPMPSHFTAPPHVAGSKFVPVIGFSGIPMWQLMSPTAVDTSEDHTLHPPVA